MRTTWRTIAATCLAVAPAAAQIGAFQWQLVGNPAGSGFTTPTLLHVSGPDSGDCNPHLTYFETVAPVGGTLYATVDFENLDSLVSTGEAWDDSPAWLFDGMYAQPWPEDAKWSGADGWPSDYYYVEMPVEAGQHIGLGVWSSGCSNGPGVAEYEDIWLNPKPWSTHTAALDPRALWTSQPEVYDELLASVGDVNLDGISDLVLAGSGGDLQLLSAVDATPLLELSLPSEEFNAVAGVGDLDGDGRSDVAAVNESFTVGSALFVGSITVFSGADGATLLKVFGQKKDELLGNRVAGVGDIDLDGVPDLAVRVAPWGPKPEVRVLSGATGATLYAWKPPVETWYFGEGLAGPGDATGDGVPDVFVGWSDVNVAVYSGATGLVAQTIPNPLGAYSWFGDVIACAGDVDGGGLPDLLAGCPFARTEPVVVVSLETGAILTQVQPDKRSDFGHSVAGGMDTNGDGRLDFVVGAPIGGSAMLPPHGIVRVYDALDGSLIADLATTDQNEEQGCAVVMPADLDGDGMGDVVELSRPVLPQLPTVVRAFARLGHPGPPRLAGSGGLVPGELVTLSVTDALPGTPGFLVLGSALVDLPFAGGVLAPQPDVLVPLLADAAGQAALSARWPQGLPAWTSIWMQAWMIDPAGPHGFSASDALAASQL